MQSQARREGAVVEGGAGGGANRQGGERAGEDRDCRIECVSFT